MNLGDTWKPTEIVNLDQPYVQEIADINGDGLPDLVLGEKVGSEYDVKAWHVLLNENGSWLAQPAVQFSDRSSRNLQLKDLNADGNLDLVHIDSVPYAIGAALFNPGGPWELWKPQTFSRQDHLRWNGRSADFNNDGYHDIVMESYLQVVVFSFDHDREQWTETRLADVDLWVGSERYIEDGDFDIALRQCTTPNGSDCTHIDYINDGAGQFVRQVGTIHFTVPSFLQSLDLEGDGQHELIWFSRSIAVFKLGDEGWTSVGGSDDSASCNVSDATPHVRITDANGDSINDLLITLFFDSGFTQNCLAIGQSQYDFEPPLPIIGDTFSEDGLSSNIAYQGWALSTLTESQQGIDWEATIFNIDGFFAESFFADLDSDGDHDTVLVSDAGVTIVYRQDPGDFNDDGVIDGSDLDLLYENLRTNTSAARATYDLNNDRAIDQLDIDFWIAHAAKTLRGDANLDGTVNFLDFLALAENFGIVGDELRWGDGDFNGDRMVNFIDFLALATNFSHRT